MPRLAACAVAFLALSPPSAAAQAPPRKVAFLVGVGDYKFNYPDLGKAPACDAAELAAVLKKGGFEVHILTDADATGDAIRAKFEALTKGPKAVGKDDVLLVGLCGHGEQVEVDRGGRKKDEPFFCPHDARPSETKLLVNVNWLIETAAPSGATTLFLIDACRDIKDQNRTRSGIQGDQVSLPARTAVLFSCKRGEVSNQSDALGHGVFTFAVLQALRGKTGLAGEVTWKDLVGSVEKSFQRGELLQHLPTGKPQTPTEARGGNLGIIPLFTLTPAAAVAMKTPDPEPPPAVAAPVRPQPLRAPFGAAAARAAQQAWAKYLKVDVETVVKLGGGETITLVLIPPGTFEMGSPPTESPRDPKNNESQRIVRLTKPYFVGKYEVTRGQFEAFADDTNFRTDGERDGTGGWGFNAATGQLEGRAAKYTWKSWGFAQAADHPVVNLTWADSKAFCSWVGKKADRRGRLPTEAEWEFACRAGTESPYSFGSAPEDLALYANVADAAFARRFPTKGPFIAADDGFAFTSPAGRFRANPFGLHDMHGGVWEWCEDYFGPYDTLPATDPLRGDPVGAETRRVRRGGAWNYTAHECRSAFRDPRPPVNRSNDYGVRVCVPIE